MRPVERPGDCLKIKNIALKMGYDISLRDAQDLWESHSEDLCAGWLCVNNEEEIKAAIARYFNNENF